MKLILGATVALLALVSVGLAVYAYTEHRQVAYLILRADALEARINELDGHTPRIAQLEQQVNSEDGPTPEERAVPAPTPVPPGPSANPGQVFSREELIRRLGHRPMTPDEAARALGLEPAPPPSPSTSSRFSPSGLEPITLEELNRNRAELGLPPLKELPDVAEPTAVVEATPEPAPPPMVYTDQQIIDSRDQGPNRPECAGVRARAMQVPTWLRTSFFDVFGCATVEDRLDQLELEQRWDRMK
jgi:hypothetical protein